MMKIEGRKDKDDRKRGTEEVEGEEGIMCIFGTRRKLK